MISAEYQLALEEGFRRLHGCGSKHVETVPVIERYQGKTVWEGEVEVFDLIGLQRLPAVTPGLTTRPRAVRLWPSSNYRR
jgi:hypothetical protein